MYNKNFYLCKGYNVQKNEKKPLIFYHIPKCAGTTFSVLFSFLFSRSLRIPGSPFGERKTNIAFEYFLKNKKKIFDYNPNFIYGHFPYEISKYFSKYLSVTIIREPVERCISHFKFLISRNIIKKNSFFENDYLKYCFENNIITPNVMTRQFSSKSFIKDNINENMFLKARNVLLKEIDLIYDIKNSSDLYNLLISLYDLPNLFFQEQQKTKNMQLNFDDEKIEIIKKYNEYDIKLYEYLITNKAPNNIDKQLSRDVKKYFYSSPDLLINKKKQCLLDESDFVEVNERLKNQNFIIKEF